jgi:bifunctional non-homologous end joining protein LigD
MLTRLESKLSFVEPQSPTITARAPAGDGWIHEVKFDGYRTQLVIEHGRIRAFTRNGHDWSGRYWPICKVASWIPASSAIIDGEVCVTDARGVTDFDALTACIGNAPGRLAFVAFDLLHLDGADLRDLALIDRRERLEQLIGKGADCIQFS